MNHLWKRRLAISLFALGLLLGIVCAGLAAWGDLEATVFDAAISPDALLDTLRCPILITQAETTTISAAFHNPLDRKIEFFIQTHVSQGYITLMRESRMRLSLAPGEGKRLEWTVTPADAAFGRVVLARVHVLRNGSLPYRSGACGIVVIPLPFLPGDLLFALLAAAELLGLGSGIALWVTMHRPLLRQPLAVTRAMGTLTGIVVIATVLGVLGAWLITLVLLLFTLLLVGVMIGYLATSR